MKGREDRVTTPDRALPTFNIRDATLVDEHVDFPTFIFEAPMLKKQPSETNISGF